MFNSKDFETIRTAIQHKRTALADSLKKAIADEGPSRHVADLASALHAVDDDDAYYLRMLMQPRSLFTALPTRHVGIIDDAAVTLVEEQTT